MKKKIIALAVLPLLGLASCAKEIPLYPEQGLTSMKQVNSFIKLIDYSLPNEVVSDVKVSSEVGLFYQKTIDKTYDAESNIGKTITTIKTLGAFSSNVAYDVDVDEKEESISSKNKATFLSLDMSNFIFSTKYYDEESFTGINDTYSINAVDGATVTVKNEKVSTELRLDKATVAFEEKRIHTMQFNFHTEEYSYVYLFTLNY